MIKSFSRLTPQCSFISHLHRHALNVQIYLKMHRADYAEKQLRIMQQIDEDHTLTQLATAWHDLAVVGGPSFISTKHIYMKQNFINISLYVADSPQSHSSQGGSKIQEAYLIFQDFSEKFLMTGLVLNGKAVCCMQMGNFEEAESLLLDALTKVNHCLFMVTAEIHGDI